MEPLVDKIEASGWAGRVITENQLARMLTGTPQRRYNLVNRALRRGDLLRLKRGRYLLAPDSQRTLPHPFVVAQALRPGCYVSFESALAFHGWIPESAPVTQSVVPGRRRYEKQVPRLGLFRFYPLPLQTGFFLEGVDRWVFDGQVALLAQPLRALLDLFCHRKQDYPGLDGLLEDLRIDPDVFASTRDEDLELLQPVYKHRRMTAFIKALRSELAG